jgi:hypothetical protein
MGSINIYINVETALFGTSIFLLVDMDLKCTIVSDNFIYILSMNPSIDYKTLELHVLVWDRHSSVALSNRLMGN